MTKNEKLLLAMSELDEDIISEAAKPYKKPRKLLKAFSILAASVAVVTVLFIGARVALYTLFDGSEGDAGSSDGGSSYPTFPPIYGGDDGNGDSPGENNGDGEDEEDDKKDDGTN